MDEFRNEYIEDNEEDNVEQIDFLEEELEDKIPVGKIDVDECREIAMEYGVMSIPTVIYFKNGLEAKRFVGIQTKDKLLEAAKELE